MDPNANLQRQREIAAEINALEAPLAAHGDQLVHIARLGAELAELVQALDEWRRNGGFDPYGG
jgi:hypothetical protein